MNQVNHPSSSVPGDTKIEPRELTAPADRFMSGSVLVIAVAGAIIGAALGAIVALVYETFDPLEVNTLLVVPMGAIVGAVAGGMVAGRQIVGRFDQK